MKTLYLLRHAKAEPAGKDGNDQDRVLSLRGVEACATVGSYMKSKGYLPEIVLSSTSARTRETFEQVKAALGITPKARFEDKLYLAEAETIIKHVQSVDHGVSSVMVVGHNPGMHHAALLLSEPGREKLRLELELKYPTCALTVLQFDAEDWKEVTQGKGRLADFITPAELQDSPEIPA
jgi:phosphohistidine phosphatase